MSHKSVLLVNHSDLGLSGSRPVLVISVSDLGLLGGDLGLVSGDLGLVLQYIIKSFYATFMRCCDKRMDDRITSHICPRRYFINLERYVTKYLDDFVTNLF